MVGITDGQQAINRNIEETSQISSRTGFEKDDSFSIDQYISMPNSGHS